MIPRKLRSPGTTPKMGENKIQTKHYYKDVNIIHTMPRWISTLDMHDLEHCWAVWINFRVDMSLNPHIAVITAQKRAQTNENHI